MSGFKMLRPLQGHAVRQRTEDAFISANDLLSIGNRVRGEEGLQPRAMSDYFEQSTSQEFIEVVKYQEKISRAFTSTKGRTGGTWLHPVVALDFALWLTPKLKYEVYKWVTDNLLGVRVASAGSFKNMNIALDKRFNIGSQGWIYANVANDVRNALRVHDWNCATEDQLAARDKIQDTVVLLCETMPSATITTIMDKAINHVLKEISK